MTEKPIIVVCSAIAGLVIMECVALANGINGTLYTGVVAIVAGLGGYLIKSPVK